MRTCLLVTLLISLPALGQGGVWKGYVTGWEPDASTQRQTLRPSTVRPYFDDGRAYVDAPHFGVQGFVGSRGNAGVRGAYGYYAAAASLQWQALYSQLAYTQLINQQQQLLLEQQQALSHYQALNAAQQNAGYPLQQAQGSGVAQTAQQQGLYAVEAAQQQGTSQHLQVAPQQGTSQHLQAAPQQSAQGPLTGQQQNANHPQAAQQQPSQANLTQPSLTGHGVQEQRAGLQSSPTSGGQSTSSPPTSETKGPEIYRWVDSDGVVNYSTKRRGEKR